MTPLDYFNAKAAATQQLQTPPAFSPLDVAETVLDLLGGTAVEILIDLLAGLIKLVLTALHALL